MSNKVLVFLFVTAGVLFSALCVYLVFQENEYNGKAGVVTVDYGYRAIAIGIIAAACFLVAGNVSKKTTN